MTFQCAFCSLERFVVRLFDSQAGDFVFKKDELRNLHEHVKNLLESSIGSFFYDRFAKNDLKMDLYLFSISKM